MATSETASGETVSLIDVEAASALLDLIARKAESLRDAGVTSVELASIAFELAPREPAIVVEPAQRDVEAEIVDPLKDPATYGIRNGRIPSFRRPPDAGDE